jgi:hypothetical protein
MSSMRPPHQASAGVASSTPPVAREEPDRVYVRRERCGRILLLAWGIEHRGVLSEVVQPVAPGQPSPVWAIERDLRRGVGLSA